MASLVTQNNWAAEQENIEHNTTVPAKAPRTGASMPPLDPFTFNPYYEYISDDYLEDHFPVQPCYLDERGHVSPPEVYAYPGVPQNMTRHFFGSYEVLGLRDDVCWDRFGRLGPYGYGYDREEGGLGLAEKSEKVGSGKVWKQQPKIDWRGINWADVQQRCYEKNKMRFDANETTTNAEGKQMKKVPRQAYILRSYTGYKYDDHQLLTIRAMITELSLKTGGEYDVHLLVQVKDDSIPIWTDKEVYRETLEESVPEELWGITTLWSEELMRLYYPGPFGENFENPSGQAIHGVYRGAHFPLFWFAQQHPEYDYYWNWEMDLRYTGHYYEFNKKVTDWARKQPRKGLWERNARYYLPDFHGDWANFSKIIEMQTLADSTTSPIWGPVTFNNDGMLPSPNETKPPVAWIEDNYEWGVGEEADLITFNPMFDPGKTNWVFRADVDGYSRHYTIPPRRTAIITVSRLSKRLLDIAHKETYLMHHSMFPEMWSPTIALHHGLKATYAPHPMYFERNWPLAYMNQVFNHPKPGQSVFGFGEHNQLGNSFYYHSIFAGNLWRRWLGYKENGVGGSWYELSGTGRMCLRSTLFHPVKYERGPTD